MVVQEPDPSNSKVSAMDLKCLSFKGGGFSGLWFLYLVSIYLGLGTALRTLRECTTT